MMIFEDQHMIVWAILCKTIIFLSFPEPFPGSSYGYPLFIENIDEILHSVSLAQFARDQGYG